MNKFRGNVPNTGPFKGFVIAVIIGMVLCCAISAPFIFTKWMGG